MLSFSEQSLVQRLKALAPQRRTAFAASCAGRLFPVYEKIANRLIRNDMDRARAVLARVWDWALVQGVSVSGVDIQYLTGLISSEDEGKSFAEAIADDALAAIAYAARSTREPKNSQEAAWAARRIYEAADRFVARKFNASEYTSEMASLILGHEVVQEELWRQERDLSDIEGCSRTEDAISVLKERAGSESALPRDAL